MEKNIDLILKEFSTEELEKIIFTLNYYSETYDNKKNKQTIVSSVSANNDRHSYLYDRS